MAPRWPVPLHPRPGARSIRASGLAVPMLCALLLTGGCGFHLRGGAEIPPAFNPLYLEAAGHSGLHEALAERLAGSEVELTRTPGEARLIVRVLAERRWSRIAAVDRNGKVLARELWYGVRFDARTPDGRAQLPVQTIELARPFDNPEVEVLGKQLEETLIWRDLTADAADQLLARLRAVLLARLAADGADPAPGGGDQP